MKLKTVLNKISHLLCGLSCVAIGVMMILMVADALSRKFIGAISGGYYTTIAILAILLYLPQGYAQLYRAHITVDLVTSRLNDKTQIILRIITTIFAAFFFGIITYAGTIKAVETTMVREEWMGAIFYPAWPFRWAIPVGLAIFTLQLLVTTIDEIRTLAEGR